MRVSDRQQLEAVYKVKEELLKTDVKLLNGNHENGDLDPTSPLENMDYVNDKEEVNGIEELCFDSEKTSGDLAVGGLTSEDSASRDLASEALTSGDPTSGDPTSVYPISGDLASDELVSSEMVSSELVSSEQVSDDLISSEPVPGESVSTELISSDSASDGPTSSDLASGDLASASDEPTSDEPTSESAFDSTFEPSSVPVCEPVPEADNTEPSSDKADSNIDADEAALETDDTIICSDLSPEKKVEEDAITESALGEEAISSSMEIDQSEKNEENSADLAETLAPAEDELTCFSKASLLPIDETNPDLEEKMEGSFGSPSKQESSESLPKEAFLVLSDEEDISGEKDESEVISQNETCSPEEVESNEKDSKPEEEEQVTHEDERPSEKSEFFRRKRSKSEDMDNVQSKRRRYMEEEYEAEFQVVQWLLEEKLCALQCAVFDKTLAELKTRVEKIECNKRHKTVLTELQAKIARLTKRFGAAKEDLKKRQENPPNPPASPVKSVVDISSNNNVPYRTEQHYHNKN
ncbi:activating transcription factor 7-interacting protein 1, partial [Camelus ferus]